MTRSRPFGERLTRIAVSERHHEGPKIDRHPTSWRRDPRRPRPAVLHPRRRPRPALPRDRAPVAGAGGARHAGAARPGTPPGAAVLESLICCGRRATVHARRSADAAQPRALPGRLDHLVMRPVHPQDHKPGAAGRAGQPVRLLVPARRPRLQVDRHPAVGVPLQPCGPVARATRPGRSPAAAAHLRHAAQVRATSAGSPRPMACSCTTSGHPLRSMRCRCLADRPEGSA
jgi:hypothetical protein